MLIRKLILCLVLSYVGAWILQAQVNSRDPQKSPTFQTTCDNEINNEPVAKAVPIQTTDTPAASLPAQPVASNAQSNPDITVDQIVKNAIRRDEELRELREGFTYQLRLVTERLDDENKVVPEKTKTVTAKIKPGKDITFSADFNDDSKDSGNPDSSQTSYAGATGGRGLRSAHKKASDDDDDSSNKDVEDAKKVNAMLDMGKIAPRFKYSRMEDETVRDRKCYVIKFSPKKDQPFSSREEKVINKVGGTIWIDQNDFSIVQTKGKLTEEVDVAWFLATMKGLDFSYQTSELQSMNIPVPSAFFMNFDLNIMGYRMAQRQTSQMTDYQPVNSVTPPTPNNPPAASPAPSQ
ncbi:MAG: hypothetical protein EB090_00415 [Verrucomicrobia bacterium]|nr:hypothetical protein [Verrucomicrobiota bacterium]